jgi:hypothetical protein
VKYGLYLYLIGNNAFYVFEEKKKWLASFLWSVRLTIAENQGNGAQRTKYLRQESGCSSMNFTNFCGLKNLIGYYKRLCI